MAHAVWWAPEVIGKALLWSKVLSPQRVWLWQVVQVVGNPLPPCAVWKSAWWQAMQSELPAGLGLKRRPLAPLRWQASHRSVAWASRRTNPPDAVP